MACGALLAGLLAPGCRPTGGGGPRPDGELDVDSLSVELGLGDLASNGRWNLVRIWARAKKGVFSGEVVVRGVSGRQLLPERYTAALEVGEEMQRLDVPILARGASEVSVTIYGRTGLPLRELRAPLLQAGLAGDSFRVLRIGDGQLGVGALKESLAEWLEFESATGVRIGEVRSRELPSHFLAYDSIDLVIVEQGTLTGASRGAVEALGEWLRRGGTAVLVPGPEWTSVVRPEVLALFGLDGPLAVSTDRSGDDSEKRAPLLYEVTSVQDGSASVGSPLVLKHRIGSGRTYLQRLSPRSELLLAADAGDRRHRDAIRTAWRDIVVGIASRPWRGATATANDLEPHAVQALFSLSGFSYPTRESVALFVALYLGVGFCLVGWVCKRAGRLEYAYAITFVVAILASVGIYRFGLLSAIQERSVNIVSVGSVRSGGKVADVAQIIGIQSPSRRTIEPDWRAPLSRQIVPSQPRFDPDASMPSANVSASSPHRPEIRARTYEVGAGGLHVGRMTLLANATTYVRVDRPVALDGVLRITRTAAGYDVHNDTPHDMELVQVAGSGEFSGVRGSRYRKMGTWSAGERRQSDRAERDARGGWKTVGPLSEEELMWQRHGGRPRSLRSLTRIPQIASYLREEVVESLIRARPVEHVRDEFFIAVLEVAPGSDLELGRVDRAYSFLVVEPTAE